jgi:hypothetical protein
LSQETNKQKSQLSGDDRSDKREVVMHISIGDEASTNVGTVRSVPPASADSTKMTTANILIRELNGREERGKGNLLSPND